jgi:PHD/YefM family antitoxin component YafN of YafNO toxin-antitoxin module
MAVYNNNNSKSLILINIKDFKATKLIEKAYKYLRVSATIKRG